MDWPSLHETHMIFADAADRRPRYDSATQAYRKILYEEGMRGGLYRGYFPNLIRNSVISATELVSCNASACSQRKKGAKSPPSLIISANHLAGRSVC